MWHLTFCLFFSRCFDDFFLFSDSFGVCVYEREFFSSLSFRHQYVKMWTCVICLRFIFLFSASTKQNKTGLMYRIICEHDNENCYFITNTNATVTACGMWILIFFIYIKTEIFFNDFIFRSRNLIRSKISMSCWQ